MHRQWCANVAEVEVDVDTGIVEVLNVWHQQDMGRVIWYKGTISQIQGGLIHGMSRGIFEEQIKDEATGVTLNPNHLDYKLPTMWDIPDIQDIGLFEVIDPYGPFGAKGLGEPCVGAIAPAVANAVYNACGVRVNNPPLTPDKILRGLGKA
jgi:CO/xanthine dehydrogenase Mo-binding subunit